MRAFIAAEISTVPELPREDPVEVKDQVEPLLIFEGAAQSVFDIRGKLVYGACGCRVLLAYLCMHARIAARHRLGLSDPLAQILDMGGKTEIVEALSINLDVESLLDDVDCCVQDMLAVLCYLILGSIRISQDIVHDADCDAICLAFWKPYIAAPVYLIKGVERDLVFERELVGYIEVQRKPELQSFPCPLDGKRYMVSQYEGCIGIHLMSAHTRIDIDDMSCKLCDCRRKLLDKIDELRLDVIERPLDVLEPQLLTHLPESEPLAESDELPAVIT